MEACDDGNADDTDACLSTCQAAACGDGIVQTDEECDDGNGRAGDWCDGNCLKECLLGYAQWESEGNCYAYFPELVSWDDANTACLLVGAHLVSVQSVTEQTALAAGVPADAWIGLTDQNSEGTYLWYEGPEEVLTPTCTNWATAPAGAGDCAAIESTNGTWSEASCVASLGYVCEHEW
jgi:cysteine-rich repeat protein